MECEKVIALDVHKKESLQYNKTSEIFDQSLEVCNSACKKVHAKNCFNKNPNVADKYNIIQAYLLSEVCLQNSSLYLQLYVTASPFQ